jgi:hypothetical protein
MLNLGAILSIEQKMKLLNLIEAHCSLQQHPDMDVT